MADSIEIRLDQLTEAIKGLYAKSSTSQGEIYNALTSLSQRYENLTNVSSEKIAVTLINEFRKTIDIKYGQTNQYVKDLEASIKNFMQANQNQSPRMEAEISKLLTDTSNTYAKLTSQDLALQKIFNTIEMQQKNETTAQEVVKLSENFMNFSRGFENITSTLNKNFADFLNQVKQFSSKEQLTSMQGDLDTIRGNVNSVISAISIIDTKYKDLTNLIDTVQNRENIFNDALNEVRILSSSVASIRENINSIDPRIELQALGSELKTQLEAVKYEIQKVINIANDSSYKTDIQNLNNDVTVVSNNVVETKDEIKNISNTVLEINNALKSEVLNKANQTKEEYERYLNTTKEYIKSLLVGLSAFKKDLSAINEGNIKILQEPIERAMEDLKNQEIGKNIKDLSNNLKDVTSQIQSSIHSLQSSLNDMNSESSLNVINQISEAIPAIADKLEIFRNHVVSENSANLAEIKNSFSQAVISFQSDLKSAVDKIQEETKNAIFKVEEDTKTAVNKVQEEAKNSNNQTLDDVKIDLQRVSDHITDSVDNVVEKIQKDYQDFKSGFDNFSAKQKENSQNIENKLTSLELVVESFSNNTNAKLNDTLNTSSARFQDSLNEIKSDIIENIQNINKSTKGSISEFQIKIDKVLKDCLGNDVDTIAETKSLKEAIIEIESKIERTNLQQIHNAKELLEEIQTTSTHLASKINSLEEGKNTQGFIEAIAKISEKLQNIEDFNNDLYDDLKETKDQIEQKLKDNVQKISALMDKPQSNADFDKQNNLLDNLSSKVTEYLSNFEFLKNNISQEIKENLESEFNNLSKEIQKIKSQDENSNYSYTLEDVESDLAKIRLYFDKNNITPENFKTLVDKVSEIRALGLENVKINRDLESELGNLSGWYKDAVAKIDELQEKFEDFQNIGFEDIKTRLVQSDRLRHSTDDLNKKIEGALKYLIKNTQSHEEKIADLSRKLDLYVQTQKESFNPSQFIDIFYENMTQTKMLSNRVEIIEEKINSIQNAVSKLISYVEQ